MSQRETSAILEISISILFVVLAAALFVDSLDLPESLREPLGSSSVPQVVCLLVIGFSVALIFRSARIVVKERARRATNASASSPQAPLFRKRLDLAAKVFVGATIYVALMQTRLLPSELLTPLFLGSSIIMLTEFRRSALLPAIVVAIVIGLGTNYLFTDFFYIDLP